MTGQRGAEKPELLATGNFDPSESLVGGGEITRLRHGGGDFLYGESAEEVVRNINSHDRLTLHYSEQTKADMHQSAFVEVVLWVFLLLLGATMLTSMLPSHEARRSLFFYLMLPGSILGALFKGWRYTADRPNYGWISHRVIDFVERRIVLSSCLLGKLPEQRVTNIDFSEVRLVCYVNNYWEGDPSIDLMVVMASELKKAKYVSECPWIANIYMGQPDKIQDRVCTSKIPAPVRAIADAFIARTGIVFVDKVTLPGYVPKKKAARRGGGK